MMSAAASEAAEEMVVAVTVLSGCIAQRWLMTDEGEIDKSFS